MTYRITGYFRSRNIRRTLDNLNFEGFIFVSVAVRKYFNMRDLVCSVNAGASNLAFSNQDGDNAY